MVGVERYMSKLKFTQEELKGDDWDKQYYKVKAYLDSIRRITYASPVEASKSGEHIHSLETMLRALLQRAESQGFQVEIMIKLEPG